LTVGKQLGAQPDDRAAHTGGLDRDFAHVNFRLGQNHGGARKALVV
jgi:hypothetical protein